MRFSRRNALWASKLSINGNMDIMMFYNRTSLHRIWRGTSDETASTVVFELQSQTSRKQRGETRDLWLKLGVGFRATGNLMFARNLDCLSNFFLALGTLTFFQWVLVLVIHEAYCCPLALYVIDVSVSKYTIMHINWWLHHVLVLCNTSLWQNWIPLVATSSRLAGAPCGTLI
jgi:hypothetical protein